jgi:hypothetical protein
MLVAANATNVVLKWHEYMRRVERGEGAPFRVRTAHPIRHRIHCADGEGGGGHERKQPTAWTRRRT